MEEVCGQRAGGLEHIIDRHHGPTVFMQSDFQLGAWRVQPQLNSVACDQRTIRLEPKMMEVLVCLANGSGDVVPKEQLVREVWRDTFVTDDVLIRCVSGLRRVFGDDAGKSTVIETIPKKGYRLLVPVTRASYHDPTRDRSGHEFVDSIAILPFENTDHHAELDYLSDGLTETIINISPSSIGCASCHVLWFSIQGKDNRSRQDRSRPPSAPCSRWAMMTR